MKEYICMIIVVPQESIHSLITCSTVACEERETDGVRIIEWL